MPTQRKKSNKTDIIRNKNEVRVSKNAIIIPYETKENLNLELYVLNKIKNICNKNGKILYYDIYDEFNNNLDYTDSNHVQFYFEIDEDEKNKDSKLVVCIPKGNGINITKLFNLTKIINQHNDRMIDHAALIEKSQNLTGYKLETEKYYRNISEETLVKEMLKDNKSRHSIESIFDYVRSNVQKTC